jgi:hypothetical protein
VRPSLTINLPDLLGAARTADHSTNPSEPVEQKVQTLVLELVMRGLGFEEIAKVCGLSEVQVEKLASSKWFENEVERRAREGDLPEDSLRSLLRVVAFKAAVRLGALVNSSVPTVALGATKLALEYSLAPMKALDQSRGTKVPDVDEAKREAERLTKELSVLSNRRVTI